MATIKEVAQRAGVSPSTVSNVFLGRVPVRDRTKRRVLSAAQRLGYQPDGLAQALRTGRRRTLGLLVPHITNPTIAAIVNGATRAAQEAGYAVSVCAIENDPRLQETYLDLLRRERVAAVISQPAGEDPEPYRLLQRTGVALVFVDRRPVGLEADFLTPDYRGATRAAVAHLLETGRRRVALLTGPRWVDSTRERIAGYEAAHIDAGVAVDGDLLVTLDRRRGATISSALVDLLRRPRAADRPDAVVAGSAAFTLTALACLHDSGVAVPKEVALVGTGQVDWARFAAPPLSMIEIDGGEIGRQAVELALARADEAAAGSTSTPARSITLPAGLVVRGSSAPQSA
jgi:DNA-binding LacI/PurR family transcriptional regulator